MFDERNTTKGFLIGVLTGGVVGGSIALLLAPKSGKELRKDISEKTDDLLKEADLNYQSAKNKAASIINEGRIKADKLFGEAKKTAGNITQNAANFFKDTKDEFAEGFKDFKDKATDEGNNDYNDRNTITQDGKNIKRQDDKPGSEIKKTENIK